MEPPRGARPRPRETSERQLGFRIQAPVRWLAPSVLVTTGAQSLVAGIFGSYADKRELQGSLPAAVHRHDDRDELWFDFVADLGDGFDATYSVASLLAADAINVPGCDPLPRGRLLVMGGDEVYPGASTTAYEDRTKGVYRAALPEPPDDPPTLFALPGNHDWYDGLTSFLRIFAQQTAIGGWATAQTRSYFAIELPQRWWLFAIDTQFDDYVDAPQLAYFREAAAGLQPGDAVILCTSKPAWVDAGAGDDPKGYDTIEFFTREIVRPRGASVRVMLTGDSHHYARYAERDGSGQRVTCGLGGAYLAATHRAPEELVLPPAASRVREPSRQARFDLAARYPSAAASAAMTAGIFRLPWRNPGFWGLTGLLQSIMTLALLHGLVQAAPRPGVLGVLTGWAPAAIAAAVLVVAAVVFARTGSPPSRAATVTAGVLHGAAHLALTVGWLLLLRLLHEHALPEGTAGDWWAVVIGAVATPLVIGFLDAEIVAVYLLVASRFGVNLNEVFAGQAIVDHKGFLRLHIAADGALTIHPIALARVCRSWTPNPDGGPTDPWLLPDEPLAPALIEPPVRVPRTP